MSDKHLERKEVLNLVYTRQADRMADAYARLMADFSQMTAWGRGLESDLSWARYELMQVKAEVENFNEYLKWHADGHKFAAWQVWRSQHSDGFTDKESKQ